MKTRLLIIIGIAIFSSIIYFGLISTNDSYIIPIELKVAQKLQGGSAWHFSGTVIDSETEIKMSIRSPDGNIISTDTIIPDEYGNFDTLITTGGPLWANAGIYFLILEQGEFKEIQTFKILENEIPVPLGGENEELPIPMCAYIGFEKYPQNLFDEFLQSPYNKDVTFLNFTDADLKQVPLFYELILEVNQRNYPLNDRVRFLVSFEEYSHIKNYLEQKTYFEIKHNGEVLSDQIRSPNIDGHYRHPRMLIDDKLYGMNGLNFSPVFSNRDVDLGLEYDGTLEEMKKNFFADDNPNRSNIIYFELNEKDIENIPSIKDAIDKMHTSDAKIRKSLDVGSPLQKVVRDFFKSENQKQFNGDESKYTGYFILNNTMYETSFVIC